MSLLKVSRPQVYDSIGTGSEDHVTVGEMLKSLLTKRSADWWFRIYFTGSIRSESSTAPDPESILKKLGFIDQGVEYSGRTELGEFYQGWGDWYSESKSRLMELHQKIETAASF
jgi:hypothetical protein